MNPSRPGVALPADTFISAAEYSADLDASDARLAARRRVERRREEAGADVHAGSCAPCLRAARFSGPGPGGEWASGQRCDCEDELSSAARMLLHAAIVLGLLRPWTRLLLYGPPAPVHRRLQALAGRVLDGTTPVRPVDRGQADLVLCIYALHCEADLGATLSMLRGGAGNGATLLAAEPFDPEARHARGPGAKRVLGWDLLEASRAAGWDTPKMLRIWSRELGYLGPANFLLQATAASR